MALAAALIWKAGPRQVRRVMTVTVGGVNPPGEVPSQA